jgi:hypothetical protein
MTEEYRVIDDREAFIVIWSDSVCVEIRCQETTSEEGEC